MPISLPGEDRLRPGAQRDLVVALHELYIAAGSPPLRRISDSIKANNSYDATLSHETIGRMLNGLTIPNWLAVKTVVQLLAGWGTPPANPDEQAKQFLVLWNAAKRIQVFPRESMEVDSPATEQAVRERRQQPDLDEAAENSAGLSNRNRQHETTSVILASDRISDKWDISLPIDVSTQAIIDKLVESDQLPFQGIDKHGVRIRWRLRWQEADRYLKQTETLRDARVSAGDTLVMRKAHSPKQGRSDFQFHIPQAVLSDIHRHAASYRGGEVGGLLLGRHFEIRECFVTVVNGHCPVPSESSHGIDLNFEGLNYKSTSGVEYVVGWYHSHTTGPPFMSVQDRRMHSENFPMPWHVSCVVAVGEQAGFWRLANGKSIEIGGNELKITE